LSIPAQKMRGNTHANLPREKRVHDLASAVDKIEHALWQPGFFQQFCNFDRRQRNFFARLEHERVAARDGDGIHPERNHRGKIKRGDAGANPERLADGLAINAARDILQNLAHQQRRHAQRKLDNLDAALHVTARFNQRLAVFARVAANEVLKIILQQHFEPAKDARPLHRRRFHPGRKRGVRRLDGGVHIRDRAGGTFSDDFADGGIENRRAGDFWLKPFAADKKGTGFECFAHKKSPLCQRRNFIVRARRIVSRNRCRSIRRRPGPSLTRRRRLFARPCVRPGVSRDRHGW